MKTLNHISQSLYEELRASGSGPGILYGLPKVHKANFKSEKLYRPIFAAYNCASYNLSKYLVKILNPFAENQYTIKNSAEFRREIEQLSCNHDYVMASFDIKDLYTNIPLRESIQIAMNLIDANVFNIPHSLFQKMLELSVYNTMFKFDGIYYRQVDGLGMGLPLSPTLANIFLCFHETTWLQNCPEDFKPVFFKRYMDDTFAVFRNKNHVNSFLQYLNDKHQNITFTHEEEDHGRLPFLDCMVSRTCDRFTTSVYRKPTFSGLGLSFFSFSPIIYKINSIKTLIFRANNISSTFTSLNKEISKLVAYFMRMVIQNL